MHKTLDASNPAHLQLTAATMLTLSSSMQSLRNGEQGSARGDAGGEDRDSGGEVPEQGGGGHGRRRHMLRDVLQEGGFGLWGAMST